MNGNVRAGAQRLQQLAHRADVADHGQIFELHWLLAEQASGQARQSRILGPADANSAPQGNSAANYKTFHFTCASQKIGNTTDHCSSHCPVLVQNNHIRVRTRPQAPFVVLHS